jgi:hypothetical protein
MTDKGETKMTTTTANATPEMTHEYVAEINLKLQETTREYVAELKLKLQAALREINEGNRMLQQRDRAAEKTAKDFRDKLGHDLKFEYIQYKNVADAPMTAELGEIMRDYLKSMFKTLVKSGISFEPENLK